MSVSLLRVALSHPWRRHLVVRDRKANKKNHLPRALANYTLCSSFTNRQCNSKVSAQNVAMNSRASWDVEMVSRDRSRENGYASVANWIARDPENETFIFRKSDELRAQNLMYMQSELLMLESRLKSLDSEVQTSNDIDLKDSARTWEEFAKQRDIGNAKLVEIKGVMDEIQQR